MGIIKQGILGGFSNKVGAVVGSSWKGIAVMKAKPLSVANPRTTKQVNARSTFSDVSKIASAMLSPVIADCWNRWAKKKSGYNEFVQKNIKIAQDYSVTGSTFFLHMIVSDGELLLNNINCSETVGAGTKTYAMTWDDTLTGKYDKATDIVKLGAMVLKLDSVTNEVDPNSARIVMADNKVRTAEASTIEVELEAGEDCFPFAYVVSADGYFRSENLNVASLL